MASASGLPPPNLEPPSREAALSVVALATTLLFAHGQTTERTVGIQGTSSSQIVSTKPLGIDMNRVLAITRVADWLCDGTLRGEDARSALLRAGNLPPVSTLRFTSFCGHRHAVARGHFRRSRSAQVCCWVSPPAAPPFRRERLRRLCRS
jgi:hypothetical protein